MNEQEVVLSTVLYYAVEGNYSHMRTSLLGLLKRFGSDPLLLFWRGFSMILEGRLIDGIRELTNLQDTPELLLSVPQLLKYAHRKCDTVDNEAVKRLDDLMKSSKSSFTSKDYYYAGIVMWLIGKHDRARDYIDKILKAKPQDKEALAIRGWIDLTSSKEPLVKKSLKYFEDACNIDSSPPLEAILGKIRYHFNHYSYTQSLDVINTFAAQFTDFIPLHVEKINVQVAKLDWEGAVETAKRCNLIDSSCVQAATLLALEKCVHIGDMSQGAQLVGNILVILDQSEPRSHALYYNVARAFSRVANGHRLLLQQTITLMDRAISIYPTSYEYVIELGYQHMMAGSIEQAMKCFKMGISVDQTSVPASIGIVHCLLSKGHLKSASQQLEFLTEVATGKEQSAEVHYLNAVLVKKKGLDPQKVIQLLNNAVLSHFSLVKGYCLGLKYLFVINPFFVMKIAETMMDYAPSDPSSLTESSSSLLQSVAKLLAPLATAVPGLLYIQLILAKIKYLSRDFSSALTISQTCIDGSYKTVEAHLLQAVIYFHQGDISSCSLSLEAALSCSFEVQQYSLYHIVKGRQQLASGKLEESRKSLETALSLKSTPSDGTLLPLPSVSEWVGAYLSLSDVLNKLQMTHRATMVMQEATEQFAGTPDEARITTANAELLLARGNSKEALNLLSTVTEDKPFYIQAKERMAFIYLNHERNKTKYIACYKELAEKLPGPPTTQLLGDAYMNIQELDSAIELFEAAIRKSPKDGVLASKIGQAYLKAHSYSKAVQYYENSLRTNDIFSMRHELASVYLRLKQLDKAEKTVMKGLQQTTDIDSSESVEFMREQVKYHTLLTKIYQLKGITEEFSKTLEVCRNTQTQLLRKIKSMGNSDLLKKEIKVLIDIILQIAKHFEQMSDGNSKAEECYKQVLELDEESVEARVSLVKLYLSIGDTQLSEEHCIKLMKTDSDDSSALLMAELLVLKDNPQGAAKHMEDILMKQPGNTECLARLIDVKRRVGDLESVKYYITQAESHSAKSAYEPKLMYCKALYHRYMGKSDDALMLFNQIRSDPTCGEEALLSMIDICLINDDNILGMESLKSTETDASFAESEVMALRTAEKLLKEMNPTKPSSILRLKVLENIFLLSSKSRGSAEKVLTNVQELSPVDRESASVLLLLATAYIILKQVPRARNQLKRLSKLPWAVHHADDLERGWILLADVYMQSGKYDLANEQLRRCLKYNKSCSKAWECLGFISEKDHAYQDATGHYENAWKHSHMMNPVIGYRLAFNLLKSQQHMKAVDVCHQVLDKHSMYPRIKKDILDKARSFIRV